MFNVSRACDILIKYGVSEQDALDIAIEIQNKQICLGNHVYCVTQYSKTSPYEVIDAVITRTHITRVLKKIFSVEGKWARSKESYWCSPYCANFTENSIEKNEFFTEAEAQKACDKKNANR